MHMLRMRQKIRLFEPGVADAFKHKVIVTARADQIVHGEVFPIYLRVIRELKQKRYRAVDAL